MAGEDDSHKGETSARVDAANAAKGGDATGNSSGSSAAPTVADATRKGEAAGDTAKATAEGSSELDEGGDGHEVEGVPRPKIHHIQPRTDPQSWSNTIKGAILAVALVLSLVGLHQGLVLFTGGVGPHEDEVQLTFAMIKPDCMQAGRKDDILQKIQEAGFKILKQREVQLSVENAQELYQEHAGTIFFDDLVHFMTSGPVTAMVLEKNNAIKDWRALIGPTNSVKAREVRPNCLRALYGTDNQANCLHGSDSASGAEREINLFNLGDAIVPPHTEEAEAGNSGDRSEL